MVGETGCPTGFSPNRLIKRLFSSSREKRHHWGVAQAGCTRTPSLSKIAYTMRRASGTYVFRARIFLLKSDSRPISLSLRTKDASVARIRAAAAKAALPRVEAMIEVELKNGGARSASEQAALVRAKLDLHLGFAVSQHDDGDDPSAALRASLAFADYYGIAARSAPGLAMTEADEQRLRAQGRDDKHVAQVRLLIRATGSHQVMSDALVRLELARLGMTVNEATLDHDRKLLLETQAEAQRRAACLYDPAVRASAIPVQHLLDHGHELTAPMLTAGDTSVTTSASMPIVTAPTGTNGHAASWAASESTNQLALWSSVVDDVVAGILRRHDWSRGVAKDGARVAKQFAWMVADRPLDHYAQSDAATFATELMAMPKTVRVQSIWNEPYAEAKKSFPALSKKNTRNKKTFNKDLSYLSSFANALIDDGYWSDLNIDFTKQHVDISTADKRGGRMPWTLPLIQLLFSAPIWHGNNGFKGRLRTGTAIYHDAAYFLPLMMWWLALRQNEAAGVLLDEVIVNHDHHRPYLIIRENSLRGLKTEAASRYLPVPTQLIDLGFLDYVAALKASGTPMLFPELWTTAMNGADQFKRIVWDKHLAWFLKQPGAFRPVAPNGKLADMYSIRTTTLSFLSRCPNENLRKRFAGHEITGVTAINYEKLIEAGGLEAHLADTQNMLDEFMEPASLTMTRKPIKLLPLAARSR